MVLALCSGPRGSRRSGGDKFGIAGPDGDLPFEGELRVQGQRRRSAAGDLRYYNAQMLMWFGGPDKLTYVEGYVLDDRLRSTPALHGWVMINDKIVDPTVATRGMIKKRPKEPALVLGTFDERHRAYLGRAVQPRLRPVAQWRRGQGLHRASRQRLEERLGSAPKGCAGLDEDRETLGSRLHSWQASISYAVFCLKKKKTSTPYTRAETGK